MLDVKVGEDVILFNNWMQTKSIEKVEKITPTGLIKVKGMTFRQDGTERTSDVWPCNRIKKATPEDIKAINEECFVKFVAKKMRNTSKLTYDQAVRINMILESEE